MKNKKQELERETAHVGGSDERGQKAERVGHGSDAVVIGVLKLISVVFRARCGPLISTWHCC